MEIRLVRDEDYAEIARLRRHTIRNVNVKDYSKEIIETWSAKGSVESFKESKDQCKRWVAVENDRIIGFCEHALNCELSRIYVHQTYLRKGIGSKLLEVAEASLEEQGCSEITLESTITAKDFYEKNGYKVIRKSFHKDDRAPTYEMHKNLATV